MLEYTEAELTIICFDTEDVITTSPPVIDGTADLPVK